MSSRLLYLLFIFISYCCKVDAQNIVINEISQGSSGSQEYIEFLIVGSTLVNCDDVPACIDLRGWVFDDNK